MGSQYVSSWLILPLSAIIILHFIHCFKIPTHPFFSYCDVIIVSSFSQQ